MLLDIFRDILDHLAADGEAPPPAHRAAFLQGAACFAEAVGVALDRDTPGSVQLDAIAFSGAYLGQTPAFRRAEAEALAHPEHPIDPATVEEIVARLTEPGPPPSQN